MQDFPGISYDLCNTDTSDYDEIIGWFASEIIAEFELELAQVARLEEHYSAPSFTGDDH